MIKQQNIRTDNSTGHMFTLEENYIPYNLVGKKV